MVKKDYERFYERVYSFSKADPTFVMKREQFTYGSFDQEGFFSAYSTVFRDMYLGLWDAAVKLYWYQSQVKYNGKSWFRETGRAGDLALVVENYIPERIRLKSYGSLFPIFFSYIKEFYPEIGKKNPVKHKDYFKFPFSFISPSYLLVVGAMTNERGFLLRNAEERKMSYAAFLDYVANFVLCCNQELGEDVFALAQNQDGTFRVSDLTKKPR